MPLPSVVGLLFIDFPGAQLVVRVRTTEVFPNCPSRAVALRAAGRHRGARARLEARRVGV